MNRFEIAFSTVKTSFQVLLENRTLLVFPIISAAATAFIALFFLAPLGAISGLGGQAGTYLDLACLYIVSMFVATYFNVAFFHAILSAFHGEKVEVRESLSFAASKAPAIFMWSMAAGLVGLLLRRLEERSGALGRLLIGLLGATWSIAATFAVPVIVTTAETNPVEILKASAAAIKKTWGEDLVGFIGFGVMNMAVGLGAFAWIVLLVAAAWNGYVLAAGGLGLAGLVVLGGAIYFLSVATQVFKGALYIYAVDGRLPGSFTQEQIDGAFKRRAA